MDFASLFAPLTIDEFVTTHWCRQSLFLTGRPERYSEVAFDFEEMLRELGKGGTDQLIKAQCFDSTQRHREMWIAPSQMRTFFDAGMTVCAARAHEVLPRLSAQLEALKRSSQFFGTLQIGCYWSPTGTGFGLHYDAHGVFICQLRGRKRWWYSSRPDADAPAENLVASAAEVERLRSRGVDLRVPSDEEMQTCVLAPGDMLYLPAGTFHRTSAEGGESMALTLRALHGTPGHVFEKCITEWIKQDEAWSNPLPVSPRPATGQVSDALEQVLSERVAALQAFAERLTFEDLRNAYCDELGPTVL